MISKFLPVQEEYFMYNFLKESLICTIMKANSVWCCSGWFSSISLWSQGRYYIQLMKVVTCNWQWVVFKDVTSLHMWPVPFCVFGFLLCKVKIMIIPSYLTEGTRTLALPNQTNQMIFKLIMVYSLWEDSFTYLRVPITNIVNLQNKSRNNRRF